MKFLFYNSRLGGIGDKILACSHVSQLSSIPIRDIKRQMLKKDCKKFITSP
jgi:hypothetical protein